MINTFNSLETITQGLQMQQLLENITASNLANPSVDANGYLVSSLQQANIGTGPSDILYTQNGNIALSSGPVIESITSLRSSFLDAQIQNQSTVVGYNNELSSTLNQINGIINSSSTGTLSSALTQFATDWSNLAANPSSVGLRSAVEQSGSAFASLARNQYSQLQSLQEGLNGQVLQSVNQINELLQQLAALNKDLLNSQGANVNSLLDARDYALDQLSLLMNIQTNYGTDGTVDVYLSNSSQDLVDATGASVLQTNVLNPQNPSYSDITIQNSEGSFLSPDVTSQITGGELGGELQARDNVVQSYLTQVNQIATSVMNVTNVFNESGYAANGTTTGTAFFTGSGAQDIDVNASIASDPTYNLIGASLVSSADPNYAAESGDIASYLGNLSNLLANNFIESNPHINAIVGANINPALSLGSQAALFKTPPGLNGSFTVDGSLVTWNNGQSINQILANINAADPNVYAVFNQTAQRFYMFSATPITIADDTGNFTQFATINNVLTSSIQMNNSFAPTEPSIVYGFPNGANAGLNSSENSSVVYPNASGNLQAFQVTPSLGGTFILDGVTVNWTNDGGNTPNNVDNQSLYQIITNDINAEAYPGTTISAYFNTSNQPSPQTFDPANPQTLTIFSANKPLPITITDSSGNFTVFTGLNADTTLGNLASGILTQVSSAYSAQQATQSQAQASLTQLNNAQDNLAGVATTSGQPGVPIANIQQQAVQEMTAYNAMLQVLQIINEMYSDLVGIISSSTPTGSFQNQTTPS